MTNHYDVIVIGVGGMGSATCYQLAKRGQKVLGLEQYDIPHTMGSSHGYTRIIRLAYYEHGSYVPLLKRAYNLWAELESEAQEQVLYKTGSLDISVETAQVFKGSLESCLEHQLPHRVLTGAEINARFPGYKMPADYKGLYQADGGFLVPERAIVAFVNLAHQHGAEIHAREKVLAWEAVDDGVQVKTNKATYQAGQLIITAGAWNGQLIPNLNKQLTPERQVLAWLQPQQPSYFTPANFPVFNLQVEEDRYYGFPVFGVPGFKFGKYGHLSETVQPDTMDREPNAQDEAVLRQFASQFFPNGTGPTMSLKTCMFTNSPDDHFIIDRHPQIPQVLVAAGFSGHGYKFASVIGEIMADLATEGQTKQDIELFKVGRFSK